MHFSNLKRDVYAYLIGDGESLGQDAAALLQDRVVFCENPQDADLLICSEVPQEYDPACSVPLLCIDAKQKSQLCEVIGFPTADYLDEYLGCAVMDVQARQNLCKHAPFVCVAAGDAYGGAQQLCNIVSGDERLFGMGAASLQDADLCRAAVLFLDEDQALLDACRQTQLPVVVVYPGTMTQSRAMELFPEGAAFCPAYDNWEICDALRSLLNLDQDDPNGLFYGAMMRFYGVGHARDVAMGTHMLQRAAQMGNVQALIHHSDCRMYAVGCHKDMAKSDQLLSLAAQNLLDQKKERELEDIRLLAPLCEVMCDRFMQRGDLQRARVIAVQAHRLCRDYLAKDVCAQAVSACSACALLAADIASQLEDMDAYTRYYLEYADLAWRVYVASDVEYSITREYCDEILGALDAIVQWLLKRDENAEDTFHCVDIGARWQQYVFETWQDKAARSALASYLDLRGELLCKKADAGAIDDYSRCIELCREFADEEDRAARFHAKSHLNLGRAMAVCGQHDNACDFLETAYILWRAIYDGAADAFSASQVCAALYECAQEAVLAKRENAQELCVRAIDICGDFANTFRSVPVWEALAKSYGAYANLLSVSEKSVQLYKQEASMWHQLHVLTYEKSYTEREKQALARAKAGDKILHPRRGLFAKSRTTPVAQQTPQAAEAVQEAVDETDTIAQTSVLEEEVLEETVTEESVQEEIVQEAVQQEEVSEAEEEPIAEETVQENSEETQEA